MYGLPSLESYALILKSIDDDWGRFVGRLKQVMKVSDILFLGGGAIFHTALALIFFTTLKRQYSMAIAVECY